MLELISIVAALMALVIGLNYKTADFFTKSQALDSSALLRMADNQLRQYVVANGRLPCPDLNGSGIAPASCTGTQQKGYLPYITLGMADKNYVFGEVPMLYGAYNDGTISLTSSDQTFTPSYVDKANLPVGVVTARNMFDFCTSLAALKSQTAATSGLVVTNGNVSNTYKAAYALALAGQANRDGLSAGWSGGPSVNAQYDGRNALSANQFELPQAAVTPRYDDRTHFRDAFDLHDYFRCEAMTSSVNLMVEAVTVQKETEDFADSNSESVQKGLVLNAVGIAMSAWQLGQAIAEVSAAGEVLGISAGLLATVSATCPLPPWVTCALIPVYAVAVGSAGTGQGLAVAAAVTAGVSLGLNITATVLYADLNSRTTTTPTPVTPTINVSSARLGELQTSYIASQATAKTAYDGTLPVPSQTVDALKTVQSNSSASVTNSIALMTNSTLSTFLNDAFTGKSATCVISGSETCAGFTAISTGTNTTIYTKDLLPAPYAPGVISSLNGYYQAVAQQGTGSTTPTPASALSSSNSMLSSYSSLLAATSAFDIANVASAGLDSTARTTALANLRSLMGDPTWNYTGTATLCGGGSTSVSSCGWMVDTSASAGSGSTSATTGSAKVNTFLTDYGNYQNRVNYQQKLDAAAAKASIAWSDRNGYKTALCGNQSPSVTWLGGSSLSSTNPGVWDATENLLSSPPTGLTCTGSAAPVNLSTQNASARSAEAAKYCVVGSAYDANLCALYTGTAATKSSIQGAQNIVDAVIVKGIVK